MEQLDLVTFVETPEKVLLNKSPEKNAPGVQKSETGTNTSLHDHLSQSSCPRESMGHFLHLSLRIPSVLVTVDFNLGL
jgi:hypothetical protein